MSVSEHTKPTQAYTQALSGPSDARSSLITSKHRNKNTSESLWAKASGVASSTAACSGTRSSPATKTLSQYPWPVYCHVGEWQRKGRGTQNPLRRVSRPTYHFTASTFRKWSLWASSLSRQGLCASAQEYELMSESARAFQSCSFEDCFKGGACVEYRPNNPENLGCYLVGLKLNPMHQFPGEWFGRMSSLLR